MSYLQTENYRRQNLALNLSNRFHLNPANLNLFLKRQSIKAKTQSLIFHDF